MTEIKVVVVDGKEKNIEVKDGLVLIFCGHGPNDGAFWKKFEECSNAELAAAEEAKATIENFNPTPWGDSLDQTTEVENNTNFDPASHKVDNSEFDSAVEFLCRCDGKDFLELVRYALVHHNKFFRCVSELAGIVNADDAYCSALIKLSRHLGVEKAAFKLFDEAINKDEYDFLEFWKALQTINFYTC